MKYAATDASNGGIDIDAAAVAPELESAQSARCTVPSAHDAGTKLNTAGATSSQQGSSVQPKAAGAASVASTSRRDMIQLLDMQLPVDPEAPPVTANLSARGHVDSSAGTDLAGTEETNAWAQAWRTISQDATSSTSNDPASMHGDTIVGQAKASGSLAPGGAQDPAAGAGNLALVQLAAQGNARAATTGGEAKLQQRADAQARPPSTPQVKIIRYRRKHAATQEEEQTARQGARAVSIQRQQPPVNMNAWTSQMRGYREAAEAEQDAAHGARVLLPSRRVHRIPAPGPAKAAQGDTRTRSLEDLRTSSSATAFTSSASLSMPFESLGAQRNRQAMESIMGNTHHIFGFGFDNDAEENSDSDSGSDI